MRKSAVRLRFQKSRKVSLFYLDSYSFHLHSLTYELETARSHGHTKQLVEAITALSCSTKPQLRSFALCYTWMSWNANRMYERGVRNLGSTCYVGSILIIVVRLDLGPNVTQSLYSLSDLLFLVADLYPHNYSKSGMDSRFGSLFFAWPWVRRRHINSTWRSRILLLAGEIIWVGDPSCDMQSNHQVCLFAW